MAVSCATEKADLLGSYTNASKAESETNVLTQEQTEERIKAYIATKCRQLEDLTLLI